MHQILAVWLVLSFRAPASSPGNYVSSWNLLHGGTWGLNEKDYTHTHRAKRLGKYRSVERIKQPHPNHNNIFVGTPEVFFPVDMHINITLINSSSSCSFGSPESKISIHKTQILYCSLCKTTKGLNCISVVSFHSSVSSVPSLQTPCSSPPPRKLSPLPSSRHLFSYCGTLLCRSSCPFRWPSFSLTPLFSSSLFIILITYHKTQEFAKNRALCLR